MRDTKINIIVSFIMGGVILVGIYVLNRIHAFMDGIGTGLLIAGIIFLSFGLGIAIIEYMKKK